MISNFKAAPYYLQIREVIYNKIIAGEYKAGDKLPAEEKLAEYFGVSRMTVCKALSELISKEYLTRIHGKGTFVSKMRKEGSQRDIVGFSDSMTQKGFKVDTTVLEKHLKTPSKEIARILNIPFTQKVLHLKRLRCVNNVPIVVHDNYLNIKLCEELLEVDFEKNSLYEAIRTICGKNITRTKDRIEAIAADDKASKLLDVKIGFPVLLSQRIAFLDNDIPFELTYSLYRSDQYYLEVEHK